MIVPQPEFFVLFFPTALGNSRGLAQTIDRTALCINSSDNGVTVFHYTLVGALATSSCDLRRTPKREAKGTAIRPSDLEEQHVCLTFHPMKLSCEVCMVTFAAHLRLFLRLIQTGTTVERDTLRQIWTRDLPPLRLACADDAAD